MLNNVTNKDDVTNSNDVTNHNSINLQLQEQQPRSTTSLSDTLTSEVSAEVVIPGAAHTLLLHQTRHQNGSSNSEGSSADNADTRSLLHQTGQQNGNSSSNSEGSSADNADTRSLLHKPFRDSSISCAGKDSQTLPSNYGHSRLIVGNGKSHVKSNSLDGLGKEGVWDNDFLLESETGV